MHVRVHRAWTTSPFTLGCCCGTSRSQPTASPASCRGAGPSMQRRGPTTSRLTPTLTSLKQPEAGCTNGSAWHDVVPQTSCRGITFAACLRQPPVCPAAAAVPAGPHRELCLRALGRDPGHLRRLRHLPLHRRRPQARLHSRCCCLIFQANPCAAISARAVFLLVHGNIHRREGKHCVWVGEVRE